jgi:hypothetical protein
MLHLFLPFPGSLKQAQKMLYFIWAFLTSSNFRFLTGELFLSVPEERFFISGVLVAFFTKICIYEDILIIMSSQAWNLWDIRDVQDGYPQYVGSRLGSNTSRLALDIFLQVNGLTVLPLKYHFYVAIFICHIKANMPAFQKMYSPHKGCPIKLSHANLSHKNCSCRRTLDVKL